MKQSTEKRILEGDVSKQDHLHPSSRKANHERKKEKDCVKI